MSDINLKKNFIENILSTREKDQNMIIPSAEAPSGNSLSHLLLTTFQFVASR